MTGRPRAAWRNVVFLLYDLLLLLAGLVLVPFYLYRGVRYGKVRRGFRERLGWYAPERLAPLKGRRVVWLHAASVGETRAAIPLVQALKAAYPQDALVVSTVTETGHAIAGQIAEADLRLFFPFDLSWVVRRALRRIRPSLVVIVETEIWPNFVRLAHRQGIPVALVNGRISDRSYPRYLRGRFFLRPILESFSAFCMQTEQDAERIRQMGAPPAKVEISRNLKFDMEVAVPDADEVQRLKDRFGLPTGGLVWVAGSTHGGEEEIIGDVFRDLVATGLPLVLVLVPRHPERGRMVAEMLESRGFSCTLRSTLPANVDPLRSGDVLVGDTVGEMMQFYATADVVFVGGSFVPVGGHNILEAALLKKPVLFGPHMQNFKEIVKLLLDVEGGCQVSDPAALKAQLARLLRAPALRRAMGEGGHALLRQNAGATAHTLAALQRLLDRQDRG